MPGRRVLCPRRPVHATSETTGDDMHGGRYLQHSDDGTWEVVGADGRPVPMAEYVELHAEVVAALAAVEQTPVDERLLVAVRCGLLRLRGPRRAAR